jgi:hypothetical protein
MPRFHPVGAAARWMSYNAWFHVLRAFGTPVALLRYESFIAAPRREVGRVMAATGHPVGLDDIAFLTDDHVDLRAGHSVAGNPMRFRTGRLELRRDEAWRRGLAPRHRRIVTALTAPLLAGYGYFRGRPGAR